MIYLHNKDGETMSILRQLIKATEDVVMERKPEPSNRQIIEDGLRTAQAQGNDKAVAFWQRSKAHLDREEGKR